MHIVINSVLILSSELARLWEDQWNGTWKVSLVFATYDTPECLKAFLYVTCSLVKELNHFPPTGKARSLVDFQPVVQLGPCFAAGNPQWWWRATPPHLVQFICVCNCTVASSIFQHCLFSFHPVIWEIFPPGDLAGLEKILKWHLKGNWAQFGVSEFVDVH